MFERIFPLNFLDIFISYTILINENRVIVPYSPLPNKMNTMQTYIPPIFFVNSYDLCHCLINCPKSRWNWASIFHSAWVTLRPCGSNVAAIMGSGDLAWKSKGKISKTIVQVDLSNGEQKAQFHLWRTKPISRPDIQSKKSARKICHYRFIR